MQPSQLAGVSLRHAMLLPKYQRFVAWRYLMERHRRISGGVAVVVQVCFWWCVGVGASCLWFPLSNSIDLSYTIGLACVAPVAAIGTALIRRTAGRSALGWLLCSLYWGILALVVLAAVDSGSVHDGVLRAAFVSVAFVLPIRVHVIWAWWRGLPTPPLPFTLAIVGSDLGVGIVVSIVFAVRSVFSLAWMQAIAWVALVVVGIGAVLLLAQMPRFRRNVLPFLLSLGVVSNTVALLALAYYAMKHLVWPQFVREGSLRLAVIVSCTALALASAASLRALYCRRQGKPARLWGELSVLAASVAIAVLIVGLFLADVRSAGENLKFFGGWSSYTPPMGLIMPAIAAAAIAILATVLLVARYFFTFFTTVSIGGVAIGTMALVIVLSVMSGFETDLREQILGVKAHIQISKKDELLFADYDKVEDVLAGMPLVIGYTPFLMTEVYIDNSSNYANVTLKGVDLTRVARATEIERKLEKGDERALAKLWPLAADGTILGAPSANQDSWSVDGLDDLGEVPTDFSGGLDSVPDQADERLDLAPDLGSPIDFSGGLESYETLDAGLAKVDSDVLDDGNDNAEEVAEYVEDWDVKEISLDYVSPEVAVLDGLLVGRVLANSIQLYTGQEVRVISPLPDVSPDGLSVPRMKNFRIAGRFFSGMAEYDLKYVYCSLSSLQDFLDLGDVVNGIEVRVRDARSTGVIVTQLEAALGPGYKVQDWKELNKALFSALKLEKIAMFFGLVLIVLVASFSIVGNLIMVVIEKAKEIAILKTLGSSDVGVMKIFVTQGLFIGLVGTSLGVFLGLGACFLGKTFGVPLDPAVYYIDTLPIQVEFASVAVVGLAGLLISVVATLYPAYLAARMRPVEGLRWNS